jgi:FMN phosphatase YigB (HAD superfamily)
LEEFKQEFDYYVISDAPMVWINNVLDYLSIQDRFESKFSGVDLKKKEGLFSYVLEQIVKKPIECIMVGDEIDTDIIPASALGINSIYVGKENMISLDIPVKGFDQINEYLRVFLSERK